MKIKCQCCETINEDEVCHICGWTNIPGHVSKSSQFTNNPTFGHPDSKKTGNSPMPPLPSSDGLYGSPEEAGDTGKKVAIFIIAFIIFIFFIIIVYAFGR